MKSSLLNCISTYHYQILSLILFFFGLCGVIISDNLLKIFISLEFLINAVNILFISFASYKADTLYLGYTIVLYISAISAITMAIGVYFTYLAYKKFGTISISKIYSSYKETK